LGVVAREVDEAADLGGAQLNEGFLLTRVFRFGRLAWFILF